MSDPSRQASRHTARLMNNTKWRECIRAVCDSGLVFEVAWVGQQDFDPVLSSPVLGRDGAADPGFGGGPFLYRDIRALRVPLVELVRNPDTGARLPSTERSDRLRGALSLLGQLPAEVSDGFLVIRGYGVGSEPEYL